MAHGDAREGKWKGNWRMEWVASTLHTISEHGVFTITTAEAHTSAASSRLNWRPHRFKWTCPFLRKTKSGFCVCAIAFQLACASEKQLFSALDFGRLAVAENACLWGAQQVMCFSLPEDGSTFLTQYCIKNYTMYEVHIRQIVSGSRTPSSERYKLEVCSCCVEAIGFLVFRKVM